MNARPPVLFVSHGAPSVALDHGAYARTLGAFGARYPNPRAIVVMSAHWEWPGPARVNGMAQPPPIHDFSGFSPEMHALKYPAPGSPEVADEALDVLASAGIHAVRETSRGWDHGLWVPMRLLYPEASRPVVQISLPIPRSPDRLFRMGRALSALRDQGVLLLGSGGIVHNLRRLDWKDRQAPAVAWAAEFDAWVADRILAGAYDELRAYAARAPHADLAVPTSEHFDPLFFALGALGPDDEPVWIHEGFEYASLSMRCVAFQPRTAHRPA
jgi:4,5-DOPA dioxygenase extradiol